MTPQYRYLRIQPPSFLTFVAPVSRTSGLRLAASFPSLVRCEVFPLAAMGATCCPWGAFLESHRRNPEKSAQKSQSPMIHQNTTSIRAEIQIYALLKHQLSLSISPIRRIDRRLGTDCRLTVPGPVHPSTGHRTSRIDSVCLAISITSQSSSTEFSCSNGL